MAEWFRRHRVFASWVASGLLALTYLIYLAAVRGPAAFGPRPSTLNEFGTDGKEVRAGRWAVSVHGAGRTEVHLRSKLVLSDDGRDSLLVTPHFVVPGEQVVAPQFVLLSFTAAGGQVFDGRRRFGVIADGGGVSAEVTAMPTRMQDAGGAWVEYMTVQMDYEEFVKVANGRDVKVVMGERVIALSGEHLAALGEVRECVEASYCGRGD